MRQTKLDKKSKVATAKSHAKVARIQWFQEALVPGKDSYSLAEIREMIQRYIDRFQDELATIREESAARGGRVHASREDAIVHLHDMETSQFHSGFEIPDLRISANVQYIRIWKGEQHLLPNIIMATFTDA
eukprot:m.30683 g.30683  ORF g.30683 m.30683 type:complete len:131 (-) comp4803_c0_seq1:127-519(-)